jgi:hypothetical protein
VGRAPVALLVGALACNIPMVNGILPGERDLVDYCQRFRAMCAEIRLDTGPPPSRTLIDPAQRQRGKASRPISRDDRARQSP